jgi:hypothetical protein
MKYENQQLTSDIAGVPGGNQGDPFLSSLAFLHLASSADDSAAS